MGETRPRASATQGSATAGSEPRQLEPGMLLLDPGRDGMPPTVWTVTAKRTIIAHHGSVQSRATLTKSGLPKGWQIVNNRPLAKHLIDNADQFKAEGTAAPNPPNLPTHEGRASA